MNMKGKDGLSFKHVECEMMAFYSFQIITC